MKSFNVLALNSNFQIVGIVSYINLQWSRKWHECGSFSISVPLEQYTSDWKYIYAKDRPEIGEISQINYISSDGVKMMMISGYFMEYELSKMIVYPKPRLSDYDPSEIHIEEESISNIIFPYSSRWEHQQGSADVVAHSFFNTFNEIKFKDSADNIKTFNLGILDGGTITNQGFKQSDHYRNGEDLSYKIYDILKPSGASYRIDFNFETLQKQFVVVGGKDKTENTITPIVFSTKYGNVINPNIVISDNDRKDAILANNTYSIKDTFQDKTEAFIAIVASSAPNATGRFIYESTGVKIDDFKISDSDDSGDDSCFNISGYRSAVFNENTSKLNGYNVTIINIEFDASASSYEYMEDFDIGDLVSLEIPEIDLSADVRLVGCYEVIENGKWTLSLEFGTPILK